MPCSQRLAGEAPGLPGRGGRAEGVPPRDLPHWGAGSIVVVFFAFSGFAALMDGQGSDAERDDGGHSDDTAVITESDRIPCSSAAGFAPNDAPMFVKPVF
jgi:hypothetical protein